VPLAVQTRAGIALALPGLTLPLALVLVRAFWRETPGPAFNPLLARTARFQVVFSVLLSVAIVLA